MSVADHGSVAVALPSIANEFGADLPTVQWVMIAYALTISSLLLPMGRLSDIVGRKRLYIVGFTIFLVSALLCMVAGNVVTLIASRVLMGLGASMTQATATAILLSAFNESERGKALGLQLSAVGTGAVGGPAIGGFVVEAFGWRGVFMLTIALAVIAIVVAMVVLNRRRTDGALSGDRFDLVGAVTSTAVLIVFLLAMSNGAEMGWRAPPIVAGFIVVVGLAGFFTYWELRNRSPMLDVTLFRHRVFTIGVVASVISFMSISSVRFLMPFYLQSVLGYSPGKVGLVLVPAAFAMIIMGPLGGRLSDRYGWTPFNVGGLLFTATGLFILSRATEVSPVWLIILGTVTQSIGTGNVQCAQQQLDSQRRRPEQVRRDVGFPEPREEHSQHHGDRRRDHHRRHGDGLPGIRAESRRRIGLRSRRGARSVHVGDEDGLLHDVRAGVGWSGAVGAQGWPGQGGGLTGRNRYPFWDESGRLSGRWLSRDE